VSPSKAQNKNPELVPLTAAPQYHGRGVEGNTPAWAEVRRQEYEMTARRMNYLLAEGAGDNRGESETTQGPPTNQVQPKKATFEEGLQKKRPGRLLRTLGGDWPIEVVINCTRSRIRKKRRGVRLLGQARRRERCQEEAREEMGSPGLRMGWTKVEL